MRVRKLLVVFAAFALLVAACGDDDGDTTEATGFTTIEEGTLTIGSDISWPPFEEYNDDGEVVGFDADLVNEIASRLGLEPKWEDTSFDTIFTNLAQGQFDVVASGATITEERSQQVNFSDGYFNSNQALTVNQTETPGISALADLSAGDSVAVQTGTTGAAWATENLAPLGIEVREFPQAPDTYNALEGGQVTGVIFDVDSALEEVDNREGLAVVAEIPTGELYGIAVNPENAELLVAINGALAAMVADGTYQTIYDTWFDKPEGSINYVAELPTGGDTGGTAAGLVSLEEECATYGGLTAPEGFRVNLVTDIGKIDDGTFNQFAYEGMTGALDCFGITASDVIETASEADYASNIATSLSQDPDVVVTVGFLITTDTGLAAADNADVSFIGIDQWMPEYPANMVGVLFNEHEGGFIAGAMAASLTESGVVGVVGGREDVPPVVKFVNGYEAGAKFVNPDVRVLSIYNESFVDPAKGASDAAQFMGEGADVIFGAGGPTGSGGVKAAAEAGAWAIGVDQDEYFTTFAGGTAPGSEYLATSAMKRVDLAVFRNIAAAIDGSFAGGMYILTAANDGITYAPFHDAMIPADASAKVEEVRAGLAAGTIDTGICGIDGLYLGAGSACDAVAEEPWPEKIVFGFVPSQDQEELQDEVATFAAVLSAALGIEVEGTVTQDYTGLGVALATGQADFGAFGPAGFVLADQAFPGEFVLVAQSERFGSETYHGQWFTNDASICEEAPVPGAFENLDPATGERLATGVPTLLGPTDTFALQVGYNGDGTRDDTVSEPFACNASLDAVVGKTIAFTTETSTSGFIFPTVQLLNAGITEDMYDSTFSGGHDASVAAVYNGDADIGVSFDDARRAIRAENPDVGEKVIVFNITPDIANDVIAARSALPESLRTAFFDAINDYIQTEEGAVVMDELYSWTAIAVPNLPSLQGIVDAIDLLGYSG